jgi:hypothetical protein
VTDRRIPVCALDAAIRVSNSVDSIGNSLFLYVALIGRAGSSGTVIVTRARVAGELAVEEGRIDRWLVRLVAAGLVHVHSPLPYLVARLVSWSGEVRSEPENPGNSGVFTESHIEDSYSYQSNKLLGNQAIAIGDRGAGEGGLRKLAREVVGPEIEAELPTILSRHSADHVARMLERVRRTPSDRIRKSRLALFRYLIASTDRHL